MSADLVIIPSTRWLLWPDVVLRGAGLPAEWAARLADPSLARDPDDHEAAMERALNTVSALAREPAFLEAITWQNPAVVRNWLSRAGTDASAFRGSRGRQRALTVARYVQRYTTKNDTIGFFGPVGWGRLEPSTRTTALHVGASLSRRTVYFENWAIDAVGAALAEDPEVRPWLYPVIAAHCVLDGTRVRRPLGPPVDLTEPQADLLTRCTGIIPLRELGPDALIHLQPLVDGGIVQLGLDGPIEARPERALRERLEQIPDTGIASRAVQVVDELARLRDAVRTAAGDPAALLTCLGALDEAFGRFTGQDATRRPGQVYAGRTIVYEDAVRGTSLTIGSDLLAAVAAPLDLLLSSARWLVGSLSIEYEAALRDVFDSLVSDTGRDRVPLALLLTRATPLFLVESDPAPLRTATAGFQARWARVLGSADVRATLRSGDLAASVAREFPPIGTPWSAAVHYSPDLMLDVAGDADLGDDRVTVVLNELHVAVNTMDPRVMVEQHADPAMLLARARADHGPHRVYAVPPKRWLHVNSRTYPSALLSPDYRYWTMYPDHTGAPGRIEPAAALEVVSGAEGRLQVQSTEHDDACDLLEMLGEQLSAVAANAFRPTPPERHSPRIMIDRFVMQRETWRLPSIELDFVGAAAAGERYRAVRAWHASTGLPMRCFYRSRLEKKPLYVDFSSPLLAEVFTQVVRRQREADGGHAITLTEMLPDLDHAWLRNLAGDSFTAELRLVVVDPDQRGGRP